MLRLAPALALALACAACSDPDPGPEDPTPHGPYLHRFGPYTLEAGEEIASQCVSWSIGNDLPIFANQVALATGAGFHHSNWFWVPEDKFPGPDGAWDCDSRGYDEPIAAFAGGVLFAQSTQSVAETQQFPPGVAIPIPPRAKIVSGVHMLNASDEPLDTYLDLTITPIPREDVTIQLAALSFTYEALELPPGRRSSFTVECPIAAKHQEVTGRPIDFSLYYMLPHYHELGRGIDLVATGGPAGDVPVWSTTSSIGEPLGGGLTPAFDMTGHQSLRFTCSFENTTTRTVRWGIGNQEMCVMLAFTDSEYNWGGGVLDRVPGTPVDDGGVVQYTRDCTLYGIPGKQL